MDVPAKIADARRAFDSGHDHKAGRILEQVVYETMDPDQLAQIRDIALDEQAKRGHELKYGAWHDILSEVNIRLTQIERKRDKAPA